MTNQTKLALAALPLFLFWVIGTLFPASWWGVHWLSFLPISLAAGILILVPALGFGLPKLLPKQAQALKWPAKSFIVPALITAVAGLLYWLFPIHTDFYGDSFSLLKYWSKSASEVDPIVYENLFKFSLEPRAGEDMAGAVATLISHFSGLKYQVVFPLIALISGLTFAWVWVRMVQRTVISTSWRVWLIVIGISAPQAMNFMGHYEFYAPFIWLFIALLNSVLKLLENPSKAQAAMCALLFVLALKFHTITLVLAPILALAYIQAFANDTFRQRTLNWPFLLKWLFVPAIVGGLLLYFVISGEFASDRIVEEGKHYPRFLPLISPAAPLNRYNLLSFNHLLDLLNAVLVWSPALLFLAGGMIAIKGRSINWNKPQLLLPAAALVLMSALLFMVNPLISMPFDWDLFMLPVPVLLVLTLGIVREAESTIGARQFSGWLAGFTLLCLSVHGVNASKNPLSERYETLAHHQFKTYWQRASESFNFANSMFEGSEEELVNHQKQQVKGLEHYVNADNDPEFALLLFKIGEQYLFRLHEPDSAIHYLKRADVYLPNLRDNLMYMVQAYYQVGRYDDAFAISKRFVLEKYPDERKALRMAIHCGLAVGAREEITTYTTQYLALFPGDSTIQRVHTGIQNGESMAELRQLFGSQ